MISSLSGCYYGVTTPQAPPPKLTPTYHKYVIPEHKTRRSRQPETVVIERTMEPSKQEIEEHISDIQREVDIAREKARSQR